MKKKTDLPEWIFVNALNNCMECDRCGDKTKLHFPMRVEISIAAMMKAYSKIHKKCKEHEPTSKD